MNTKRKKNSRQRGSRTHGWGMAKKHSGSGNRGGKGMAGSGKRADQKKSYILKYFGNEYFGKHGFNKKAHVLEHHKEINLYLLDSMEGTDLNLTEMGYTKLLGAGSIKRKVNVTIPHASKKAIEKIEHAGGKVITVQNDE